MILVLEGDRDHPKERQTAKQIQHRGAREHVRLIALGTLSL